MASVDFQIKLSFDGRWYELTTMYNGVRTSRLRSSDKSGVVALLETFPTLVEEYQKEAQAMEDALEGNSQC